MVSKNSKLMKIKEKAQAGSFESSDVLVLIEPAEGQKGRDIEISSTVMLQYGESIKAEINKVLDQFEIDDVHMVVHDKGSLVQTLHARVETALKRSMGLQEGTLA